MRHTVTPSYHWRKSSYSGGGEGNNCVEIATRPTHIAVRDSKRPTERTLVVPSGAFRAFISSLKDGGRPGPVGL
ncbi:DUF397 domain-containing protein [Streptomyces beihaiensis]|uniref:DUF397 domain-containing protein n=1 Tax=Streptomyces beihaiensis TaxID=2984495 RepID=A0ABT3TWC8_9ACTN|nr:DUF397 domain-containing protein [Streptomyces beihaiensis]MCX3060355.1 DUF397 domain-containing protein [Streptomyces beihaiensis]